MRLSRNRPHRLQRAPDDSVEARFPPRPSARPPDDSRHLQAAYAQKTADHRMDLLGHLDLAEMPRSHRPPVMEMGYQLPEALHIGPGHGFIGGDIEGGNRES